MEKDIVTIVARQLGDAQMDHNDALQVVEHIQRILNRKKIRLAEAGKRLIDIEEIHNNLPE